MVTQREKARRPLRRKRLLAALLILAACVLYLLGGMTLPFLAHPSVSPAFQAAYDREAFYAEGSPDRAALVADNGDALDIRLRMISEARERIIFSSFDVRDCESGRDVFSALLDAAGRGVEIQILVDGMNGLVSMSPKPIFWALGRLPNVEIRYYNTPNPLKPWGFNGRLHDKYIIIDDRLLLLGGRNTFDKFLGEYVPEAERSHDLDVLVVNTAAGTQRGGDSVLFQVEDYFRSVWEGESVKPHLERTPLFGGGRADAAEAALTRRWAALCAEKPFLSGDAPDYAALTVPLDGARLIHNPTNIMAKEPWVWWQIMSLLSGAEERARLQTPYAVMSREMYDGLAAVAGAQEDFWVLLNSVAVGDNFMASSDYTHNRQDVLDTGAAVYEYFGDYSSHGKSALVDDDLSMVGSYNLDMRSTYLDTELMLVLHSEQFNGLLEDYLDGMEAQSLRVNPDGSYEAKPGVEAKALQPPRKYLYPITSILFQPFRVLL